MKYLHSFDFLELVAETQSIRKAASQLFITSSALNRRLLALEEEIGTPLFERLPGGVRLNTAGELFLQHIRKQNADLTRVLAQITDLSGLRRGHLRLAITPELQSGFFSRQIADYRQQFPGVHFTISPNRGESDLESFLVDLSVCFETLSPARTDLVESFQQRVEAVLVQDHPLAKKTTLRLHECHNYPLILPASGTLRTSLELAFSKQRLSLAPVLYSDNRAQMQEYLPHEQAIGFQLPLAQTDQNSLRSIPLLDKDIGLVRTHIYKARGRILPVPVAKFLNFFLGNLHQLASIRD